MHVVNSNRIQYTGEVNDEKGKSAKAVDTSFSSVLVQWVKLRIELFFNCSAIEPELEMVALIPSNLSPTHSSV